MALVTNVTCIFGALIAKDLKYNICREWILDMFLWSAIRGREDVDVVVVIDLFGAIAAFIVNHVCRDFSIIFNKC